MSSTGQYYEGKALPYAFLLKMIFTAITIGCGFKGGEIVPTLFIGATLGCVLGGLLHFNPAFSAALGMVGMFCGVVNCPIASVLLSVELFGSGGIVLFATVGGCKLYDVRLLWIIQRSENSLLKLQN